jgi:transcriptional regulator EpsA
MNRLLLNAQEFLLPPAANTRAPHIVEHGRATAQDLSVLAWGNLRLTAEETAAFLRIVERASRIGSHYELFLFLQAEFQRFLPHQILISAWGRFDASTLGFDVVSRLPGMRTGQLGGCCVEPLVKDLFARWTQNERRPIWLKDAACTPAPVAHCERCALDASLKNMKSVLVHGVHDARDKTDSLYLAYNMRAGTNGHGLDDIAVLVELLIAQVHVAFQKVAPLATACTNKSNGIAGPAIALSRREREVMKWVAEGRTNATIGEMLGVSHLTVKNHVQHILKKLGAGNRTEAVIKYREIGA